MTRTVAAKSAMIEIIPDTGVCFTMFRFSGVQTREDIDCAMAAVIQLAEGRQRQRAARGGLLGACLSASRCQAERRSSAPLRLHPSEWKSGDLYWLIAVFGDKRAASSLILRLRETVFKDQPFKLLAVGEEGST